MHKRHKRLKHSTLRAMAMHLKTKVIDRLKWDGFEFVSLPRSATPHKRGVHYFRCYMGVEALWGAVDMAKEGRKCRKRIVVRPSRFRAGLHELYTYHFPKHWSAACVANRELIKEAQRQAHALEHDHSIEALEWRMRFFNHYFRVFKGGAKPEEGMKPYSRFYQYTYVAIYRQLQAERKKAQEPEPVSFEPVEPEQPFRLQRHTFKTAASSVLDIFTSPNDTSWEVNLPPPI